VGSVATTYAGTGFTSAGNNIGLTGTLNTAGLSLSATVAAQTAQSAIKAFGVSNTGQTAGNTGVSTGIDWVLAGSQSITLSQSTTAGGPNTVWVQHPAWLTTARASSDAIGLNTAQSNVTWTVNSSGISLDARGYAGSGFTSAGANIGLSGTHNSAGLSLSATVAAQSNQSAIKGLGVSNTGQTAGNTGISTGIDWVLAGSQSITLSQSTAVGGPNTIWWQHPAWLTTQSGQAFSADAQSTFQTLVFQDSNGVSFSNNAGSLRVTHGLQYTSGTSAITSNALHSTAARIQGVIGSDTTYTSGSVSLRDLNGVSWQSTTGQAFQITHALQYTSNTSAITSNAVHSTGARIQGIIGSDTTYTSGSVSLRDLNGISWQSTTGQAFQITHGLQFTSNTSAITANALHSSASRVFNIVAATDNTGGGTASLSSNVSFSAANRVTFYTSAGNAIAASINARSSNDALGLNTAGSNVTWTANSSGVSLDARGYAGTATGATNASITVNSGGVSVSVAAPGAAAENNWIALTGNTAGNTTASGSTIAWSGGNGVTLSGTNNSVVQISVSTYSTVGTATSGYPVASANSIGTITRWAAEDHRHAGVGGVGISTGNTLGTSGSQVGTYWVAGSNNISVSQITSNNGSHTLNIIGDPLASQYDPFQGIAPITNSTLGVSTVYFVPFDVMAAISASRINFFLSVGTVFSGAPNNQTCSMGAGYALYTRGTGTASDRISTVASYSLSVFSGSCSSSTRLSATYYNGLSNATSHSTSQFGVNNATVSDVLGSSIGGFRVLALPLNLTMTPGRYWLAFSNQTASQNASFIVNQSIVQIQISNNLAFRVFNAVSAASNASVFDISNGAGTYSAQTAAFPDTIGLTASAIRVPPVVTFPYFNISGIQTATNIL
jgi:hypothetical protein